MNPHLVRDVERHAVLHEELHDLEVSEERRVVERGLLVLLARCQLGAPSSQPPHKPQRTYVVGGRQVDVAVLEHPVYDLELARGRGREQRRAPVLRPPRVSRSVGGVEGRGKQEARSSGQTVDVPGCGS